MTHVDEGTLPDGAEMRAESRFALLLLTEHFKMAQEVTEHAQILHTPCIESTSSAFAYFTPMTWPTMPRGKRMMSLARTPKRRRCGSAVRRGGAFFCTQRHPFQLLSKMTGRVSTTAQLLLRVWLEAMASLPCHRSAAVAAALAQFVMTRFK